MMYDGILLKPELNDLYLKHFNPNHDPKSGQFTSGNGVVGSSIITENDIRKELKSSKKKIASQISKEMVDDFTNWQKDPLYENEGRDYFRLNGKKVSKTEMKNHLEKEVAKVLDKFNKGEGYKDIYTDIKNEASFVIEGIKEYSDAQPLLIIYDTKNKKVKNWYYA